METDQGYERDGWRAMNTALGLTAIRIPEAYGGYGLGLGDQCIVLEEMRRALLCAPYFATAVLAAGAIMNAGTEAEKQALLPGIAAGDTTATLAWVEDNGRWDAEGTALAATAVAANAVPSASQRPLSSTQARVAVVSPAAIPGSSACF